MFPRPAARAATALSWYGAFAPAATTIGDLHAVENVSKALTERGLAHVVLSRFPLKVGAPVVDSPHRLPTGIKQVVHVCGPLIDLPAMRFILLQGQRRTAVGVSVLDQQEAINRMFHAIVARDGRAPETFDLALARFRDQPMPRSEPTGVISVCLRGQQSEYTGREAMHEHVEQLFADALSRRGTSVRRISTVLSKANPESGILADFRRSDAIATTRLHGALFALAFGKPVVAIDQIGGGAKVKSVLSRIGWPLVFEADTVSAADIDSAFKRALSPDIRPVVERCREAAIRQSVAALETSVETIVHTAAADS